MAVNAKSVFLGSKYAITQMLQQDKHESGHGGWIINIASAHGLVAGRACRNITLLNLYNQTLRMLTDPSVLRRIESCRGESN